MKAGHPWDQNSVYPDGLYSFYRFELNDKSGNNGYLKENGIYEFYDQEFNESVYQLFDPNFEGFSYLTGGAEEQTDFTPPELISLEILENDVEKGDKIKIKYVATDAASDFNRADIYFKKF